jgi:hypothetical protein
MAAPECAVIAKVGITSREYVTDHPEQMTADLFIISLGANDFEFADLSRKYHGAILPFVHRGMRRHIVVGQGRCNHEITRDIPQNRGRRQRSTLS